MLSLNNNKESKKVRKLEREKNILKGIIGYIEYKKIQQKKIFYFIIQLNYFI